MGRLAEIDVPKGVVPGERRLLALDALRGLIIILMALDHANYFIAQKHTSGEYWGGPFPVYHDALSFLTRLVTHLAAPGFFFLMGAGMVLFARARRKQGWSRQAIIRHFLIRGGLLIALQLLVVNRAWELSPGGWALDIYIGVLFALGGTMILASVMWWFEPKWLLALATALFITTEFLVPKPSQWGATGAGGFLDSLSLILIYPGGTRAVWSNYPILPWLELVIFGMVFGTWLADDPERAFQRALRLGGVSMLAFLAVRGLNGFGNIRPRAGDSWIDFFNVVKYPPSMTFTLMTIGIILILLAIFSRSGGKVRQLFYPMSVFGRTPLFFYLIHLFLYAGLGLWLTPSGVSIPAMIPFWLLGLLILYPLCLWYGRLKHGQSPSSWLRFI